MIKMYTLRALHFVPPSENAGYGPNVHIEYSYPTCIQTVMSVWVKIWTIR